MTEKEVKEKLNAYRIAYRDIQIVMRRIEELDTLSTMTGNMAPKEVSVISSPVLAAQFEDKIIDKAYLEKIVEKEIGKLELIRQEVISMIDMLSDKQQKMLLDMRYLQRMSWKKIIRVMNYSERQIFRIHWQALHKIAKDVSKCQ